MVNDKNKCIQALVPQDKIINYDGKALLDCILAQMLNGTRYGNDTYNGSVQSETNLLSIIQLYHSSRYNLEILCIRS